MNIAISRIAGYIVWIALVCSLLASVGAISCALREIKTLAYLSDATDIPQYGPITKEQFVLLERRYPIYGTTTPLALAGSVEGANRHLIISRKYEFPSCAFGISSARDLLYVVDRGEPYREHIARIQSASIVALVGCCLSLGLCIIAGIRKYLTSSRLYKDSLTRNCCPEFRPSQENCYHARTDPIVCAPPLQPQPLCPDPAAGLGVVPINHNPESCGSVLSTPLFNPKSSIPLLPLPSG